MLLSIVGQVLLVEVGTGQPPLLQECVSWSARHESGDDLAKRMG